MNTAWMARRGCIFLFFLAALTIYCAPPRSVPIRGNPVADRKIVEKERNCTSEKMDFSWDDGSGSDNENSLDEAVFEYGDSEIEDATDDDAGNRNENRIAGPGTGRSRAKNRMVRYDVPRVESRLETIESNDKNETENRPRAGVRKAQISGKIPAEKKRNFYRVKKKDTVYSLSKKFDCTVDDIVRVNNLKSASAINTGMLLKIPSGKFPQAKKSEPLVEQPKNEAEKPRFIWPVGTVVNVKRDAIDGAKSIGIRITGKSGAPVLSSAQGVVKKIGEMRGYGKYIIIMHNNRFVTVYAKVQDVKVTEGENISSGRVIARMDRDEKAIHFQIGHEGKPVDPLRYLPGKS